MPTIDPIAVYGKFESALGNRNAPAWSTIVNYFQRAATIFDGELLPNLTRTVGFAAEVSANIVCAYIIADREGLRSEFKQFTHSDDIPGNSDGARLINFTLATVDIDIKKDHPDLTTAWGGIKQQMSSTIEMVIRAMLPTLPTQMRPTPDVVMAWIKEKGGVGKLHMEYMSVRRTEKRDAEQRRIARQRAGERVLAVKEAKEFFVQQAQEFFAKNPEVTPPDAEANDEQLVQAHREAALARWDTGAVDESSSVDAPVIIPPSRTATEEELVETHREAVAQVERAEINKKLLAKFGTLKDRLVATGTSLSATCEGTADLPEDRLLIKRGGIVYLISDDNEFKLLQCEASVL